MIKNIVINNSMNLISGMNKYNNEELEQVKYGLESIYLAISKVIVILVISGLLGLFKESLMFLLIFNILRAFAFGLHASRTIYCWISSSISFLLIPYVCIHYELPFYLYIFSSAICFIIILLYAPADTIKRPLINSKKRKKYKILSIIISTIYIFLIFITNNLLIKNMLMFALILESILILPITYKIFKLPYRNYLNYKG